MIVVCHQVLVYFSTPLSAVFVAGQIQKSLPTAIQHKYSELFFWVFFCISMTLLTPCLRMGAGTYNVL